MKNLNAGDMLLILLSVLLAGFFMGKATSDNSERENQHVCNEIISVVNTTVVNINTKEIKNDATP